MLVIFFNALANVLIAAIDLLVLEKVAVFGTMTMENATKWENVEEGVTHVLMLLHVPHIKILYRNVDGIGIIMSAFTTPVKRIAQHTALIVLIKLRVKREMTVTGKGVTACQKLKHSALLIVGLASMTRLVLPGDLDVRG